MKMSTNMIMTMKPKSPVSKETRLVAKRRLLICLLVPTALTRSAAVAAVSEDDRSSYGTTQCVLLPQHLLESRVADYYQMFRVMRYAHSVATFSLRHVNTLRIGARSKITGTSLKAHT